MTDVKQALNLAVKQLKPYTDTARLDAEILLAFTLTKPRTYLHTYPEATLTKEQFFNFQQLIARRSLGVPIAYLTGVREFWSLPIKVNAETLIPRPETELIVELTLSLLSEESEAFVLDLGTGSGAIALALGKEREKWQITACDCSLGALNIAEENANSLHLENIHFCHSDWFMKIEFPHRFHAIVSNPPYIAANDPHLTQGDLRFEPTQALVATENGLSALRHIIQSSSNYLQNNGLLLIEHGFDQKSAVTAMLQNSGYKDIQTWKDWQGQDRVSGGRRCN
jgi:release factor glutamine methyltransferase